MGKKDKGRGKAKAAEPAPAPAPAPAPVASPPAAAPMELVTVKKGWLLRLGDEGGWKRLYVALSNNGRLSFFKSDLVRAPSSSLSRLVLFSVALSRL